MYGLTYTACCMCVIKQLSSVLQRYVTRATATGAIVGVPVGADVKLLSASSSPSNASPKPICSISCLGRKVHMTTG